jgi:hypothetical protein
VINLQSSQNARKMCSYRSLLSKDIETHKKKKRLEWFLFCIEGTVYPRSELQEDKTREDRKKRRSAH